MKKSIRVLALLLVLVMAVAPLAACAKRPQAAVQSGQTASGGGNDAQTPAPQGGDGGSGKTEPADPGKTEPADDPGQVVTPPVQQPTQLAAGISFTTPSSYKDVLESLRKTYDRGGYFGGGVMTNGGMVDEEAPQASDASANGMAGGSSAATAAPGDAMNMNGGDKGSSDPDYSGTNNQVDGVDEGDIFKTNGKVGFLLRNGREIIVMSLAGENSDVLNQVSVGYDKSEENKEETSDGGTFYEYSSSWRYVSEMLLDGDRLVLLGTCNEYYYSYTYDVDGYYRESYYRDSKARTFVEVYEISEAGELTLLSTVEVDGDVNDSRMAGGVVYLLTTWYCWGANEDDPATYVPGVVTGGVFRTLPVEDLYLPDRVESYAWCVVTSVDVATGELISSSAVLGGWGTVYMNADSLYLAIYTYRDESPEPYYEDQYLVEEHISGTYTDLVRFAIEDGKITLVGIGTVPGSLLNQFSMDEKGGYMRVVTTTDGYNYKLYKDEKHGFVNYVYGDSSRTNGLYVLDSADMTLVAAVEGLAESERVYSVRFMGDLCYFVTFRQTDPLFAVDLSDPLAPAVLSELKITGFSNYLHPWSDGVLFGIGMEADENGRTQTMKLAMFDTSDPTDLKVLHSLKLKNYYSSALYDHHAILIDRQKNLIAFRSENGFEIYGYDEAEGFTLRAHVDLSDDYYWSDARACWSGAYLYLVGAADCHVLTLDTLEEVTAFKYPMEEDTSYYRVNGVYID